MPNPGYLEWKKQEAAGGVQLWYPPPPPGVPGETRLGRLAKGRVRELDSGCLEGSIGSCQSVSPVGDMVSESRFKRIFKNASFRDSLTEDGIVELYNFWLLSYLYDSPSPRSTFMFHDWCRAVSQQLLLLPMSCINSTRLKVATSFMMLEKMVAQIFPSTEVPLCLRQIAAAVYIPTQDETDVPANEFITAKDLSRPLYKEEYRYNGDRVEQLERAFIARAENLTATLKTEEKQNEGHSTVILRFVLKAWRDVTTTRKRKLYLHVGRMARIRNKCMLMQTFTTWREVHVLTRSDKNLFKKELQMKREYSSLSRSTDLTIENQQHSMAKLEVERQNTHAQLNNSLRTIEAMQNQQIKIDEKTVKDNKLKDEAFEGKIEELMSEIQRLQGQLEVAHDAKRNAEATAVEIYNHTARETTNNLARPGFADFSRALLEYNEDADGGLPFVTVDGERRIAASGVKDLLSPDRVVLHFLRWVLDASSSQRTIDNFTTDLQDGSVLCSVMLQLFPKHFDGQNAKLHDARLILKKMIECLVLHGAPVAELPVEEITGGDGGVNLYMCFIIFKTWIETSPIVGRKGARFDGVRERFQGYLGEDNMWKDLVAYAEEGVMRKYHRGKAVQGQVTPLPASFDVNAIVNDAVSREKLNFTKIKMRSTTPTGTPSGSNSPAPTPAVSPKVDSLSPIASQSQTVFNKTSESMNGKSLTGTLKFRITEEEVKETEEILEGHYKKIKKIHWYYSRLSVKTTEMGVEDFMRFMTDCSLVVEGKAGKHGITVTMAEQLFTTVASGVSRNILQLDPRAFVETLVRIANIRIPNSKGASIAQKLRVLLVDQVMPGVMYSDVDDFRVLLSAQPMQDVVNDYKATLLKTYNHYCADEKTNANTSTMTLKDFWRMLTEAKVTGESLSITAVSLIFSNCQSSADSSGGYDELVFMEFIEALAACALCRHPVPVLPPSCRFRDFLTRFFATLSVKSHRLRHNSVFNKRPPTLSPRPS